MHLRPLSVLVVATLALLLIPSGVRFAQAKTKAVGPPEVAWKDMTFEQKKA